MQAVTELLSRARAELGKAIVGQQEMRDQCVATLLCRGHALLEGVPGIAKTLTVKALARLLRLDYQRVQCTSDLMPADIIGTNVLKMTSGEFVLHKGPVFTELLLVDEVNRMPPRTQAALLECMEEQQVTIDGERHPLSEFFSVFATQNPIEFEGTYPLPEAQLDRFLMKIRAPYPDEQHEVELLGRFQNGFDSRDLCHAGIEPIEGDLLRCAQDDVRKVTVHEELFAYVVRVIRKTRDWPALSLGASPRAAISLMAVAKAMAAMDGRDYLVPDDVKSAALPVLRHRIMLRPEAELEGFSTDQAITDVLKVVEIPR